MDLDTAIEDDIFAYKLFDKRGKFSFFIVHTSYLWSNILPSILHYIISSEFPRIAQCTLRLTDFVPKASQLYPKMITQGRNETSILCQIEKAFQKYPKTLFSKYCKTKLINEIIMY